MQKITLAMDSSSTPLVIALNKDGKTYSLKRSGIKQEEFLFDSLRTIFSKAGCELGDVSLFLFIKGPGRFTGIRIAVTLASMLNTLNGADIASVNVFDVLKYQAEKSAEYKKWYKLNPGGLLAIVVHAFREEYFAALCKEGEAPLWLCLEDLLDYLKKQNAPLFIAGWGMGRTPLADVLPAGFTYASAKLNKVHPAALLEMPFENKPKAEVLEPLYLKPARFEMGNK